MTDFSYDMPAVFRQRRPLPRSFAQISLDRSEDHSIAEELADARRISRVIASETARLRIGTDFSDLGNIRIKNRNIVLFVRSAPQAAKLRQILPRLDEALALKGYRMCIDIKIRPVKPELVLRENKAQSQERQISTATSELISKKAESLDDSALKEALLALAKLRRKT